MQIYLCEKGALAIIIINSYAIIKTAKIIKSYYIYYYSHRDLPMTTHRHTKKLEFVIILQN